MIRAKVPKAAKRLIQKENKSYGILTRDADNLYYHRMEDVIAASGTATACINLYAKHVEGRGFSDLDFYKLKVGKLTTDKLLRKVAKSIGRQRSFYLHVNYNLSGEIVTVNHVPYKYCAMEIPDDFGRVRKIAVYDNWDYFQKGTPLRKDEIHFIDVFNPDKDIVLEQIRLAGGINKYKGQILRVTTEEEDTEYPLSTVDPVVRDCQTEAEIAEAKNADVAEGFAGNFMITEVVKPEDAETETPLEGALKNYKGQKDKMKILLAQVTTAEEKPIIDKFDRSDNPEMYKWTETSVKANIIAAFGQPQILHMNLPGSNYKKEFEDAEMIYAKATDQERRMVSEAFAMVFKHWYKPVTTDFTILPLTNISEANVFDSDNGKEKVATALEIIKSSFERKDKINQLVVFCGLTEEQAKKLVPKEMPKPEPIEPIIKEEPDAGDTDKD